MLEKFPNTCNKTRRWSETFKPTNPRVWKSKGGGGEIWLNFISISIYTTSIPAKGAHHQEHDFQILNRNPKDGLRGIQSNSFYDRLPKIWNDLPRAVVNPKDTNSFKNQLCELWKDYVRPHLFNHEQFIEALSSLRFCILTYNYCYIVFCLTLNVFSKKGVHRMLYVTLATLPPSINLHPTKDVFRISLSMCFYQIHIHNHWPEYI